MVNEDNKPLNSQKGHTLEERIQDKRRIILLPTKGETAVCNPATLDNHFVYRVRIKALNRYGEKSVLKHQELVTPYQLNNRPRVILYPQTKYEKDGIEDARLSKLENDIYGLTYVAYNENKANGGTSIALATTEDFKKLKREGIIGPRIRLSEMIKLTGGKDSYYGERFAKELANIRKGSDNKESDPFAMDKDASVVYDPISKEYIFFHRLDSAIQIARAKNLDDFKKRDFWEDQVKHLEKNTILYPGKRGGNEDWASEKIGLGGTPRLINGKLICHIHGVQKFTENEIDNYIYRGTFAELDPKTYRIITIIRNPLFQPRRDIGFTETTPEGIIKIRKHVNFPTDIIQDPNDSNIIWNYSGEDDYAIETRSSQWPWIKLELAQENNKVEKWQGKN